MKMLEVLILMVLLMLIVLAAEAVALIRRVQIMIVQAERRLLLCEKEEKAPDAAIRGRPPDGERKPQAHADHYEAPMVRIARQRMAERVRRNGYEL